MLTSELRDYEIQVSEDANERYGAFKVGTHDDLVTALGLAVQTDPWVMEFNFPAELLTSDGRRMGRSWNNPLWGDEEAGLGQE